MPTEIPYIFACLVGYIKDFPGIYWHSGVEDAVKVYDGIGTNEDVIVPSGVVTQGNYVVTYYPSNLIVGDVTQVITLWICDHDDAGDGKVHLAIDSVLSCEKTAETFRKFVRDNADHFWTVSGDKLGELRSASPVQIHYRANANGAAGEQDIEKGWIWFTLTDSVLPNGSTPAPVLQKIIWKP